MLEFIQKLKHKINKLFFILFYKNGFKRFGSNSTISFPFQAEGVQYINIGKKVHLHQYSWLLALKANKIQPNLVIDDNTYIGRFFHMVCINKIEVQKNVLISDKVYISDNLHDYRNIATPIKNQQIIAKGEVVIGEQTWLGENVCVIGASVGKHCVIGANSVVVNDIPDYSVAVGSPAIVVKKFNKINNTWEKISNS